MPSSLPFKVDTSSPVLVTGATGYVAGVLIQQLLELGVTVHAAVRDPSKTDRLQHLQDLANKAPGGTIQFFQGDLLTPNSYAAGMKGCSIVFHTASPFQVDVQDAQRDLVEPAVQGTQNVLQTCNETPTVKRVVLTSSCVAIYSDASECATTAPDGVLTEDVWNRTAALDHQPYALSKTLAEQAAWVMAGSQTQWTLTTINPSFVMGPGTKYHASSTSFQTAVRLGNGELAAGCPEFCFGVVDVRDVAAAHVCAAYKPGVKGRHILSGHNSSLYEMAQQLVPKYGADYPLPTRKLPKTLLWLLAPYIGLSRSYVWHNCGVPIRLDHSKSIQELGIEYHSLETTMVDMFEQLIQEGVFHQDDDKKQA